MSQYIEFYIVRDNMRIYIDGFSRGTFQDCFTNYAPAYSTFEELTSATINEIMIDVNAEIGNYVKQIDKYNEEKKLICEFNNSAEEKLQAIFDINNSIDFIEEEMETLESVKHFLTILQSIQDNSSATIYYGIECCWEMKK